MKKRILLVDESLTVQKVVALTLDKGRYHVSYARTRQELIKTVVDTPPHLILLSDGVSDINSQSFPKELEAWLGRDTTAPPVILITSQDIKEAKHYAGVLKKPFTPQNLQALVEAQVGEEETGRTDSEAFAADRSTGFEEDRLQKVFNDTFSNEDNLVRETFERGPQNTEIDSDTDLHTQTMLDVKGPKNREAQARRPQNSSETPPGAAALWGPSSESRRTPPEPAETAEDLWGVQNPAEHKRSVQREHNMNEQVLSAEDSMAYKSVLESEVQSRLEKQDLEEMVSKALLKIMPPIVEKLVQERLDRLLREHEEGLAP